MGASSRSEMELRMILPRSIAYLTVSGELDAAARDGFTEALGALADADVAIIDFGEVSYCDSTAITCLVSLRKRMQAVARGGAIRIVNPGRSIRRIMELCGLEALFSMHDSLRSAGLTSEDGDSIVTFVGHYDAGVPLADDGALLAD